MKKVVFNVLDYYEGQILWRRNGNMYEVWSCEDGCGDMIYQFGVYVKDTPDIVELIENNYCSGNILWQSELCEV